MGRRTRDPFVNRARAAMPGCDLNSATDIAPRHGCRGSERGPGAYGSTTTRTVPRFESVCPSQAANVNESFPEKPSKGK